MLQRNAGDALVVAAQLFLHGVVATVEVLLVLELGGQDLLCGGELAVHLVYSELLWRELGQVQILRVLGWPQWIVFV